MNFTNLRSKLSVNYCSTSKW